MQNKEELKFEFSQEDSYINLKLSDNFQTDQPIFDELAYYLGAIEHHILKDEASVHLTILEKLEILCKKAREYADEESEYADDYNEVKIITLTDKKYLGNPTTLYDTIDIITNQLLKVSIEGKYGIITVLTKVILPTIYEQIIVLSGYLEAHLKGNIYLYSSSGKLLLSDLEEIAENYNPFGAHMPYFWIKKENKWGLFDHKFNQIIPFRLDYDSCELISDNTKENIFIKVYKDGKCGLINGLLNIEVLELDDNIDDVVLTYNKTYLISKKDHHHLELNIDDLTMGETRLKNEN
ncbi:MAG: WG repeat-containing protein [Candidatus Delongbacteria bacterium]|nr:WG repeat-containing protein [Candidatus Delongbacteria bacterium]